LVDSEPIYLKVLVDILKNYGVTPKREVFEEMRSRHPDRLFDHILGEEKGQLALQDFKESGRQSYHQILLFDGIETILQELKNRSVRVGVWTARDLESTVGILKQLGMLEVFDIVLSGSCVPRNKPEADGLEKIAQTLPSSFDKMVMVGDHSHDIQAANTVGCASIFATWKNNPNALDPGLDATETISQIPQLGDWLEANLLAY